MSSLIFHDGKLTEYEGEPLQIDDKEDYYKGLARNGYTPEQYFGKDTDFHLEIFSHNTEKKWLVEVNTITSCVLIHCIGWIDFIECLARYAPIALAGAIEVDED